MMMRGTLGLVSSACIAATLALAAAAPVMAQTGAQASTPTGGTLSPGQLRGAADTALGQGRPAAAIQMADALIGRDPGDSLALTIKARGIRDLGRADAAIPVARRAWSTAATPAERYAASLVMAQSLSSAGKRTRAQWWLRRAAHHAPNDRLRQQAIRDFRYVQRRNPWATDLSFNIAPTSNANNGSAQSTTRLFDLPIEFQLSGDAQALSGTEISGAINTRYRLSESRSHQNDLLFQLSHRTYRLSDEARDLAPDAEGSDFAFSAASASFVHRGARPGSTGPYQLSLTAGQTWYGGDPYSRFLRAGASQQFRLGPRTRTDVGLVRELQKGRGRRDDNTSWQISAGITQIVGNGNRLSLGVAALDSQSDDANLDYTRVSASLRYSLAQPIAGMRFDFGLSAARKDHDRSALTAGGRTDREFTADITAVFTEVDYYGFVPSVTLRGRRTDSNIGLYDSEEFGFEMGIRSAF